MKIFSIRKSGPLLVTPIGDRLYRVGADINVWVQTEIGCFHFRILKGFVTNFRSGGWGVDPFIDQIGDEDKALVYLLHDLVYTPCAALNMEHPLSRKLADELLRAALVWAGMPRWKANVVYYAVRAFGGSAFDEDDALTSYNSKLFNFEWRAAA